MAARPIQALEELVPASGMMDHAPEMLATRGADVLIDREALRHRNSAQAEMADESFRFEQSVLRRLIAAPTISNTNSSPDPSQNGRWTAIIAAATFSASYTITRNTTARIGLFKPESPIRTVLCDPCA
jgi:hypothetical protein